MDGLSRFLRRSTARRGLAALGLLALFVVLARPICDVLEASGGHGSFGLVSVSAGATAESPAHHDDGSEPCCSSIQEGSVTVTPLAFATDGKPAPVVILPAIAAKRWGDGPDLLAAAAIPPDPPPIQQSYYARSSRLLI